MFHFKPAFSLSSFTFIHVFGGIQSDPQCLPWLLPGAELQLHGHIIPSPVCRLHYLSPGWTASHHCRLFRCLKVAKVYYVLWSPKLVLRGSDFLFFLHSSLLAVYPRSETSVKLLASYSPPSLS